MNTYFKDGHLHSYFNKTRNDRFEEIGRIAAIKFLEQKKYKVNTFDRDEKENIIWKNTDLIATKDNETLHIEASAKRWDLFRYVKEGVDVETRKLKYLQDDIKSYILMCSYIQADNNKFSCGDELLVIPMICLKMAQESCGEEFYGHGVLSSEKFVEPEHGCIRVRKKCKKGLGQSNTIEDFYRIPYKYISHYKVTDNDKYEKIKK